MWLNLGFCCFYFNLSHLYPSTFWIRSTKMLLTVYVFKGSKGYKWDASVWQGEERFSPRFILGSSDGLNICLCSMQQQVINQWINLSSIYPHLLFVLCRLCQLYLWIHISPRIANIFFSLSPLCVLPVLSSPSGRATTPLQRCHLLTAGWTLQNMYQLHVSSPMSKNLWCS